MYEESSGRVKRRSLHRTTERDYNLLNVRNTGALRMLYDPTALITSSH